VAPIAKKELEFPEKITLTWLGRHVPIKFWILAGGILVSAFLLGINASRISIIKEIFNLK
jgi:hypothetical protein